MGVSHSGASTPAAKLETEKEVAWAINNWTLDGTDTIQQIWIHNLRCVFILLRGSMSFMGSKLAGWAGWHWQPWQVSGASYSFHILSCHMPMMSRYIMVVYCFRTFSLTNPSLLLIETRLWVICWQYFVGTLPQTNVAMDNCSLIIIYRWCSNAKLRMSIPKFGCKGVPIVSILCC